MLCEKCKQQYATVHMQKNINGQITEMHLCQDCASNPEIPISFDNFFQGFLDSFLNYHMKELTEEGIRTNLQKCNTCGLTYTDFKNTGRLGCANCYNTFRTELNTIFKSIQASDIHNGKYPQKAGASLNLQRKIDNLKQALNLAIQNEEFEQAARIRDDIRILKGEI